MPEHRGVSSGSSQGPMGNPGGAEAGCCMKTAAGPPPPPPPPPLDPDTGQQHRAEKPLAEEVAERVVREVEKDGAKAGLQPVVPRAGTVISDGGLAPFSRVRAASEQRAQGRGAGAPASQGRGVSSSAPCNVLSKSQYAQLALALQPPAAHLPMLVGSSRSAFSALQRPPPPSPAAGTTTASAPNASRPSPTQPRPRPTHFSSPDYAFHRPTLRHAHGTTGSGSSGSGSGSGGNLYYLHSVSSPPLRVPASGASPSLPSLHARVLSLTTANTASSALPPATAVGPPAARRSPDFFASAAALVRLALEESEAVRQQAGSSAGQGQGQGQMGKSRHSDNGTSPTAPQRGGGAVAAAPPGRLHRPISAGQLSLLLGQRYSCGVASLPEDSPPAAWAPLPPMPLQALVPPACSLGGGPALHFVPAGGASGKARSASRTDQKVVGKASGGRTQPDESLGSSRGQSFGGLLLHPSTSITSATSDAGGVLTLTRNSTAGPLTRGSTTDMYYGSSASSTQQQLSGHYSGTEPGANAAAAVGTLSSAGSSVLAIRQLAAAAAGSEAAARRAQTLARWGSILSRASTGTGDGASAQAGSVGKGKGVAHSAAARGRSTSVGVAAATHAFSFNPSTGQPRAQQQASGSGSTVVSVPARGHSGAGVQWQWQAASSPGPRANALTLQGSLAAAGAPSEWQPFLPEGGSI